MQNQPRLPGELGRAGWREGGGQGWSSVGAADGFLLLLAAPQPCWNFRGFGQAPRVQHSPLCRGQKWAGAAFFYVPWEKTLHVLFFFLPSAFLCFLSPCPEEAVDYNFSAVGDAKLNGAGLSIFVLCALSDEIT